MMGVASLHPSYRLLRSLSSEPRLRSGLCRRRRERSRSAWRSRAHRPSLDLEKTIERGCQNNRAEIDVPNPREYPVCRCKLTRLRSALSGLISAARNLRWAGRHTVPPKKSLPERNRLDGARGGAIARTIDGSSNVAKRKRRPLARRKPGRRLGQARCRETSGRPHTICTSWHAYSFATSTHTRPGLSRPPRHN